MHANGARRAGGWAMARQVKRGKATQRTRLSREGFFEPFHIDDAPWQRLPGSMSFKTLGRYGGGSPVGVGIDILKPGQYSNRFPYHLAEEEHIFILKGSATLMLGSRKYVMKERH